MNKYRPLVYIGINLTNNTAQKALGVTQMLDEHQRFQANDELALLNAISLTEVVAKKCELCAGLAFRQ